MSDQPMLTVAEELDILYNLKDLVRKHRSGERVKAAQVFSAYVAVAPIVPKKTEKDVFTSLTRPFKELLSSKLSSTFAEMPTKIPAALLPLFDAAHVKVFNQAIKDLQKMQEKSVSDKPSKSAKSVEEDPVVAELKAEFLAAFERKNLDSKDKDKIKNAVKNTSEITVTRVDKKFQIKVAGVDEVVETLFYDSSTTVTNKEGKRKYSKYEGCGGKTAAALIKTRSKTFKTAIGKNEAAAEDLQKKQKQTDDKHRQKVISKQNEVVAAFKTMVANMDGKVLYQALATDDNLGKNLLKFLYPHAKDNGVLQDNLRAKMLDAVIWDKQVWSLYQKEDNNSENNNKRSHYEKLQGQALISTNVSDIIKDFMELKDCSKKRRDIAITKIAGTNLPRGLAEDVFLKGVYSYGMSVNNHKGFSMDKFDHMNKVLEQFGYKIALEKIEAQRACPEGAQQMSKLVLGQMSTSGIKVAKNKTIALMYKLGELLSENGKADVSSPYASLKTRAVYDEFCSQGHRGEHWKGFATNSDNQKNALKLYSHFQQAALSSKQLKTWINNLSAGRYIEDNQGLTTCSDHHIKERKFSGLFFGVEQISDCSMLFNSRENITTTISFHPADNDMHKDEAHKFDMREIYLYFQDNQYKTGSITGIREGETVYVPVTYKKNAGGNFQPIISPDTLVVTSQNLAIAEPIIPGRSHSKSITKAFDKSGGKNI